MLHRSLCSFQKETSGCPVLLSGENREAGENPARSRHCEESGLSSSSSESKKLETTESPSQGTCPSMLLCSLLSASRKGVQAARRVFFSRTSSEFPVARLQASRWAAVSDGIFLCRNQAPYVLSQ